MYKLAVENNAIRHPRGTLCGKVPTTHTVHTHRERGRERGGERERARASRKENCPMTMTIQPRPRIRFQYPVRCIVLHARYSRTHAYQRTHTHTLAVALTAQTGRRHVRREVEAGRHCSHGVADQRPPMPGDVPWLQACAAQSTAWLQSVLLLDLNETPREQGCRPVTNPVT